MRALVTDAEYSSLDIEANVLAAAGHELRVAACRTAEDVIEAGAGVDAMLVQYAPITAAVFEALPQLRLVSRYGVGSTRLTPRPHNGIAYGYAMCRTTGQRKWRCMRSPCCWPCYGTSPVMIARCARGTGTTTSAVSCAARAP